MRLGLEVEELNVQVHVMVLSQKKNLLWCMFSFSEEGIKIGYVGIWLILTCLDIFQYN